MVQGKAGPEDTKEKHYNVVLRRARSGQCFHRHYFGCREFPVSYALIEEGQEASTSHYAGEAERDLGWMLFDLDYSNNFIPGFFRARCGTASSIWGRRPRHDPAGAEHALYHNTECISCVRGRDTAGLPGKRTYAPLSGDQSGRLCAFRISWCKPRCSTIVSPAGTWIETSSASASPR